ncbi:MAG: SPFH domain-containing protein [Bryobacteraceae bacterium]|jgi:regulator of protease activity HflC (stomatin/prohibitin superfamily)
MNDTAMQAVFAALIVFVGAFLAEPLLLGLARIFGLYAVVRERTCRVYMLFGKVAGVLDEPGWHFLPAKLGPTAFFVNLLGSCYELDLRLDQEYLRSQPVNSEEGAPMGIGIWYEMWIGDPVAFLFKNTDPRGSLRANVSNATVRCLSNMPLAEMLQTRHNMSQTVRAEVTAKSQEWGYQLGSVYIRKVHFRDAGMIRQIEEKVVNRLRQVTSAIKQTGANQVSVITSSAEREAAVEFAKAAAIRPLTLGQAFQEIAREPAVAGALFETLEAQRIVAGKSRVTLLPPGSHSRALATLLAAETAGDGAAADNVAPGRPPAK